MTPEIYSMCLYARSFIGLPYIWGGDDPILGMDCSGFVQELLASIGEDPPGDQTAQALYNHFVAKGSILTVDQCEAGALAFYGKSPTQISHVAMAIERRFILEAGGGNSTTRNRDDAARQNAYIRQRPVAARKDLVALIFPRYYHLR